MVGWTLAQRGGGRGRLHIVPKNQLARSYGSGVMPVRRDTFENPYSIIEEDWQIQKMPLKFFGWFLGPNFLHT